MRFTQPAKNRPFSISAFGLALVLASAAHAGAMGQLEINGKAKVKAAGSDAAVSMSDRYAFRAGDTVVTGDGTAVLNLSDGGSLGVGKNSEVRIGRADGALQVDLLAGALLYAFQDAERAMTVRAGELTLATAEPEARTMQVSNEPSGLAGAIELLDGERVRIAVRDGRMSVTHGGGSGYHVDAGERISFLAQGPATVDTQISGGTGVEIEAPEQVGAEAEFQVEWRGPGESGDYISIAPEGAPSDAFESFVSTGQGPALEFKAPTEPGIYEIRYIDGDSRRTLRTVKIEVVEDRAVAARGGGDGGGVGAWIADNPALTGLVIAGGGYAIYEATDDDDDEPASP